MEGEVEGEVKVRVDWRDREGGVGREVNVDCRERWRRRWIWM